MKLYLLYLLGQLALPTLSATVAFLGAVWLSQSLRFVDLIVNKGVPVSTFLHLTALLLPSLLLIVLPFAVLFSVLFIYHRLTQESEITVMRAVGLSPLQIAAPCLLMATIITLIAYALSLYFMPLAFRGFRDLQFQIQRDFSYVLLQPGVFNSPTDDVTVYVHDRNPDGSLTGILVHDERAEGVRMTMMAEEGVLVQGVDGPLFVLERGNRQELSVADPDAPALSILHFDRYTLDLAASARPPEDRSPKAKEQFVHELLNPPTTISEARRHRRIAEGHKRLLWPLNALAFALIGLAALMPGNHVRRTPWRRILAAVVVVSCVQAATMAAGNLASRSLASLPLLYATAILPPLIALALLAVPRGVRPGGVLALARP